MAVPPLGLVAEDFERIEAAVLETERGRWFLEEYGRRLRATEMAGLAAALARIENRIASAVSPAPAELRRLREQALIEIGERLRALASRLGETGSPTAAAALRQEVARLDDLAQRGAAPARLGVGPEGFAGSARDPGAVSLRLQAIGEFDAAEPDAPTRLIAAMPEDDQRLAAFAAISSLPTDARLAFFG